MAKVIILDAGGVIQPDSELSKQIKLIELTGFTAAGLDRYQDHVALNLGQQSLREVFEGLARDSRREPKPTADQLLNTYLEEITLYPGAPEMIRDLYKAGYQVVVLSNNSDIGIKRTRSLLAAEGLSCVPVYGSAEIHLSKPDPEIFSWVCKNEKVDPQECWFIDDRKENRVVARSLGISVIDFNRPENSAEAAKSVNMCREDLIQLGVLGNDDIAFPSGFNRGKYPSLFGLQDGKIIKYKSEDQTYIVTDKPNADGNQEKRCLYESQLAQRIVEKGREYWAPAYHQINQLFLADFDLKSDLSRGHEYEVYFKKIEAVLKKEGLLNAADTCSIENLRAALTELFCENFNLTNVSQFYYGVWLGDYGSPPLEPFVFLVDLLKEKYDSVEEVVSAEQQIRMLQLFPDMAHNPQSRSQAYSLAQPWLTCGPPQLRGRTGREDAPKPPHSKTIGIMRDEYPAASAALSHFAAKTFFRPAEEHPIAKAFRAEGAPIIGGSSGTLGRNVLMLAPLVESGLLTPETLLRYVMGFAADLIYRGHHSFEEVTAVANQILAPLKPWFDPLRDPIKFYEQLLTPEFLGSDIYQIFLTEHNDFFDSPATLGMNI